MAASGVPKWGAPVLVHTGLTGTGGLEAVANAQGAVVVVPEACVDAVCFGVVDLESAVRGEGAWVFAVSAVGAPVEVAPQEAIKRHAAAKPSAAAIFGVTGEIYRVGRP